MVGRAFRLKLPEEPLTLLSEGQCQRLLPIGKRYRRDRIRRAFQSLGERFQNRPLEQRLQACVQLLLLANPRNHPGSQQRMAAQFEEVVVQADPFHSQDLRPDRCDALLQLATGRSIGLLRQARIRLRQRLPVELAIDRQRHPLQQHQVRRHHVVRQVPLQRLPQRLPQTLGILRRVRHHVSHQLRAADPVMGQHHGIAYPGQTGERRFDLTQFDTEAANLHLVVDTPDVLDIAIRLEPRQVAGTVQPLAGAAGERVRHEAGGTQPGPPQVTARQTGATDVQLAHRAARHRVQVTVEDVPGQVQDGPANRTDQATLQVGFAHRTVGYVHRGLGDAVHVHQLRLAIAEALEPRPQALQIQRLATEDHVAQRRLLRRHVGGTGHRHQLLERRRRLVEHRHAFAAQQTVEVFRRTAHPLRHDHQAPAIEQRAEDFPDREIEGVGMEQRPHVPLVEAEPGLGGAEQAQRVAVGEQRALGLAGRARGIDHVGQVVRR